MDREKVKKDFGDIFTNMLNVRKQLSKQIRGEKRSIKVLRTEVKRRKNALQRLSKQKMVVEENLRDLSDVQNNLACDTDDPVSPPTWTSSENESVGTSSSDDSDSVSCVYLYYAWISLSRSIALFSFCYVYNFLILLTGKFQRARHPKEGWQSEDGRRRDEQTFSRATASVRTWRNTSGFAGNLRFDKLVYV